MHISVVGLGKLGAPLAAVLADRGHDVIGVDSNAETVKALNHGRAPVQEPGLDALIAGARSRLSATTDGAAAAASTEATFIIVPTPSLPSGLFSTQYVLDAIEKIGEGLRRTTAYHLVTVTSTVAPGAMEAEIAPALERASGRPLGDSLGLCYNPEFIALGSVIHDMQNPDFVLVGESDRRAGDTLEQIHRSIVGDSTPVRRMNLVNAEVAKIAVNTYVTTKISYANMLSELCEQLPGGDVRVVTDTIGLDKRIGPRFFKAALGYGGPCFPRDNAAFLAAARARGVNGDIAVATDSVNRRQVTRLAATVKAQIAGTDHRVAVLGLSYKPGTNVVEESQGVMLANHLAAEGMSVTVFDPAAIDSAAMFLDPSVRPAASLADCVAASDVIVVTVAWPQFGELSALIPTLPRRRRVIVDCWRIIDPTHLEPMTAVIYPGTDRAAQRPVAASHSVPNQ